MRPARAEGRAFRPFDVRIAPQDDVCDPAALARALEGVSGVVHLAAVSRVVTAERAPGLCWRTNVEALETLLARLNDGCSRWIVFASSREVYGQSRAEPVAEDAPLQPMNVYARSKIAGEQLIEAHRARGACANVVRFSSVYGCPDDHADRVAPAFAWTACRGGAPPRDFDVSRFVGDPARAEALLDWRATTPIETGLARLIAAMAAKDDAARSAPAAAPA